VAKLSKALDPQAKKLLSRGEGLKLLSEGTSFEFGGRTFNVSMTHRVILEWERLTKFSFFGDSEQLFERPSLSALGPMIFCLIADAGYEGDLDSVLEPLAKGKRLKEAFTAVTFAYLAGQIDPEERQSPPEPTMAT
jgi:hypothetical protein